MARISSITPAQQRQIETARAPDLRVTPTERGLVVREVDHTGRAPNMGAGATSSCAHVSDESWARIFGPRKRPLGRPGPATGLPVKADGAFGRHSDARAAMDRMTAHLRREGWRQPGDIDESAAREVARTCAYRKDSHFCGEPDAERAGRDPIPQDLLPPTAQEG